MTRYTRVLIAMIITLLMTMSSSTVASASDGYASIGLRPVLSGAKPYFVIDGKSGASVREQILVGNTGTKIGMFSLYSVDATTGMSSGTVYAGRDEAPRDVGKWLHIGVSQLTLEPGQERIVDFTVTVPQHVRDGEHVGGIVAALTHPVIPVRVGSSGFGVRVHSLTITAVQVNLPGPRVENLQAAGIQVGGANGYQSVEIGLRNAGNVMLKPHGTLRIMDAQGAFLQQVAITMDTFLPETAIDYPILLQKTALGSGTYRADLVLVYGDRRILRYKAPFTITAQKLGEIFQTNNPLARPTGGGLLASVPPWALIPAGLFLLIAVFCCGFKVARLGGTSRLRGKG